MHGRPTYLTQTTRTVFYRARKRDYLVFFGGALLVVFGASYMASYDDLADRFTVSEFLIGSAFLSFGYLCGLFARRHWALAMLGIAALARLAILPMEPSMEMRLKIWEGEALQQGFNPYKSSPASPELEPLRDWRSSAIESFDEPSRQPPLSLAIYSALSVTSQWHVATKFVFVVLDSIICLLLFARYGSRRALLYAWNPMAIYACGGGGHGVAMAILPMLGGFLIWDNWVDRKGGATVINANGGLNGGLGQMICFAAFLIGIAVALNALFLPVLLWLVWHVLRRAGFKAGLTLALIGGLPLAASLIWAALSLGLTWERILATFMPMEGESLSLFPWAWQTVMGEERASTAFYYWLIGSVVIIGILKNDTMERFAAIYLSTLLVFLPHVYPWQFLWMAPFAIGHRHYGFAIACVCGFAFYLAILENGVGERIIFWLPFAIGSVFYVIKTRPKKDGIYVHQH